MAGFYLTIQIVITIFCLLMVVIAIRNMLHIRRDERLVREARLPADPPLISVCVPARNEARNIAACLESLVRQDYPNFEVVMLDDCSTDGTGDIARAIAAEHPNLKIIGGVPLPPGWIGKAHACHQMSQVARGRFLLFTDADTVFSPRALRHAVLLAEARRADLLSGLPRMKVVGFWEKISVPMLGLNAIGCMSFDLIELPGFWFLAAASGAFLFFRREAYEAIGGHLGVRDHIVEDVAFARTVKRRGLRLAVTDVGPLVSCRMYASLREVWEGFTKNFNATFPKGLIFVALFFMLGLYFWPWFGFVFGPALGWSGTVATGLPLIQIVSTMSLGAAIDRRLDYPSLSSLLLTPFSALFLTAIGLASWSRAVRKKPTPWRDRQYELWKKVGEE